jgi:hypothetical protein
MADNRLYIVDTETGEEIMVAKSPGQHGWLWMKTDKELDQWLDSRDMAAVYAQGASKLTLKTEWTPREERPSGEWNGFGDGLERQRARENMLP